MAHWAQTMARVAGLGSIHGEGQVLPEDPSGIRELRRSYHDRIADLREKSLVVVQGAVDGVGTATRALLDADLAVASHMRAQADEMLAVAASIDSDVVGLLALESPVARDLRMILSSRDVTQLGLLCIGLCVAVADRVGSAGAALGPDLRGRVEEVSAATSALLGGAQAAWATLDPQAASETIAGARPARALQLEFFAGLLRLTDVPMDAALDLGMAARAYERLVDHAVAIAERVLFATDGISPPAGL
jgi:phosphate transport system protein